MIKKKILVTIGIVFAMVMFLTGCAEESVTVNRNPSPTSLSIVRVDADKDITFLQDGDIVNFVVTIKNNGGDAPLGRFVTMKFANNLTRDTVHIINKRSAAISESQSEYTVELKWTAKMGSYTVVTTVQTDNTPDIRTALVTPKIVNFTEEVLASKDELKTILQMNDLTGLEGAINTATDPVYKNMLITIKKAVDLGVDIDFTNASGTVLKKITYDGGTTGYLVETVKAGTTEKDPYTYITIIEDSLYQVLSKTISGLGEEVINEFANSVEYSAVVFHYIPERNVYQIIFHDALVEIDGATGAFNVTSVSRISSNVPIYNNLIVAAQTFLQDILNSNPSDEDVEFAIKNLDNIFTTALGQADYSTGNLIPVINLRSFGIVSETTFAENGTINKYDFVRYRFSVKDDQPGVVLRELNSPTILGLNQTFPLLSDISGNTSSGQISRTFVAEDASGQQTQLTLSSDYTFSNIPDHEQGGNN